MTRLIDQFEAILLDMGQTFMFNVDRFSEEEDFGATYLQLGGQLLNDTELRRIILKLFDRLQRHSRDSAFYSTFPTVLWCLENLSDTASLDRAELDRIEQVFALHEIGTIPKTHASLIRQLRQTHRLGVVSNIWSKSNLYFEEFDRAGISDLFDVTVFSSDYGHIKPSPHLFAKALESLDMDPSKVVFVGDSLKRDIAGAKAVGMSTIWINASGNEVDKSMNGPDRVIQDLQDLLAR
jgi:HAD superfamily hydrolase (TIGR01509 family)